MFISILIALLIVGPLGNLLNDIVQAGADFLRPRKLADPDADGRFPAVPDATGTVWAMTLIATSQISTLGYEVVNGPGMLASNIAQGGATLAVAVKTKNKDLKQLASSSGFTAVMGITEPCLYGVLLKLKRPFVASMIGGAVGGIYAGISGLVRYSFAFRDLRRSRPLSVSPMNVVQLLLRHSFCGRIPRPDSRSVGGLSG
ncbi:MAG: PTS transporter subunit EIIC [Eisenbergiella sp.]